MNFSGLSNRKIVGKLMRIPLHLVPKGTIMPVWQGRLQGKKWTVGAGTHGCWLGSYEYEKQKLFEATIQPGTVVFDIGANVGFYSLLASQLIGPTGQVICFESVPRNLRFLKRHLRLNRIKNATVIEAAVTESCGETYFQQEVTGHGGHITATTGTGGLRVQTVGIDELLEQGHIPPRSFYASTQI